MIKSYYCTKDGYLTRRGSCDEAHFPTDLEEGEILVEGDAPADLQPPPVRLSYSAKRREEYPAIGAQLDAIWHAMDQGILPKIEPMYSDIKAVKEANPKPSN